MVNINTILLGNKDWINLIIISSFYILVPNPAGLSSNNLDDAINVLRNHATDFAAGGLTSIGGVPSGVPPHSTNGATTTSGPTYGLDDLSAESVAAAAAVAGGYQLPHHQPDTSVGGGMGANIAGGGGAISKKRKAGNSSGGGSNLSGEDLKPSSSSVGVGIAGASTSTATSSTKRGRKVGRKANADKAPPASNAGKFSLLLK